MDPFPYDPDPPDKCVGSESLGIGIGVRVWKSFALIDYDSIVCKLINKFSSNSMQ